ncbi:TetR/AcrR family transcriptional regulator [Clostridium estertheticum]|uniref:TetR/AcrR family transcriptional regulator n=1 Tax=Clostridium estertheticum TaxID=238834 RepID=UPI001C6E5705|nr:TetR/AcrR family transcriptional regulator [Clostridium estertheticum]MBW9173974.1 TetR/AcrR family transcriptional regulator [Clostridium estertheticum]WLC77625.1 TetR/AcrR family transcriptional regulator [Clostridium estertheticum]
MRISKKHEERKNEILDTSEMLFATKGYVKTTVNDILQLIGIAKGTFYYYFQSKEEVMNEIVMRFIGIGVGAAKAIAQDPNLNAQEKIFQIIMPKNEATTQKKHILEQLHQVNNAEMHQKSLVETILQLTPIIVEIVEQGIKEGSFKTPYPREVVEFLLVSSQFLFDVGLFQWQPQEIFQKAKAFEYILETMLGTEKGSFSYIPRLYEKMLEAQQ